MGAEHADGLVAHFPPVAVRAVQQVASPSLPDPGDVGQLVADAGGDEETPGRERPSLGQTNREPVPQRLDLTVDDLHAVAGDLGASDGQQFGRWHPVAGQEAVHVRGGCVAGRAGVDHGDPAAGPAQDQCGAQAGCSATDDHDVIRSDLFIAITSMARACGVGLGRDNFCCCFRETVVAVCADGDLTEIDAVLAEVGPRLKQLRTQRDVTLTELAAATGISKSTLSRLESGQRKPSLELLLPIAQAHRIPLDELVGAPDVGDPRIRLKPEKRNGRVVVPLTRQPQGMHAWKVVIPPERR